MTVFAAGIFADARRTAKAALGSTLVPSEKELLERQQIAINELLKVVIPIMDELGTTAKFHSNEYEAETRGMNGRKAVQEGVDTANIMANVSRLDDALPGVQAVTAAVQYLVSASPKNKQIAEDYMKLSGWVRKLLTTVSPLDGVAKLFEIREITRTTLMMPAERKAAIAAGHRLEIGVSSWKYATGSEYDRLRELSQSLLGAGRLFLGPMKTQFMCKPATHVCVGRGVDSED
jgi:hypothetical protein